MAHTEDSATLCQAVADLQRPYDVNAEEKCRMPLADLMEKCHTLASGSAVPPYAVVGSRCMSYLEDYLPCLDSRRSLLVV
jgi:hypothetical protein